MIKHNLETDRVKTDILGLDNLISGGFPKSSNILISGEPGSGKTIFSLEFLYRGALNKEIGIYFTFEEKKENLFKQAIQFGFDLEKLEKKNLIKIISIGSEDISKQTINDIFEIINSLKAKRVVIDSITTLSYLIPQTNLDINNDYSIKNFIYTFISKFSNIDTTTLFISQKDEKLTDNLAQYLCDGVFSINYESLGGEFSRNLVITKMRKTKNDENLHPLEIRDGFGIVVHNI